MKAGLITVFVLVLAGLVSGCGQKGPLYPAEQTRAEANESSTSESSTPENDDRSR